MGPVSSMRLERPSPAGTSWHCSSDSIGAAQFHVLCLSQSADLAGRHASCGLYTLVIIAAVVASWLIAFGVLNTANQLVRQIVQVLDALTDPLFRRVRRIIPPIGGLDLSPIIVLIGIELLQVFPRQSAVLSHLSRLTVRAARPPQRRRRLPSAFV